MTQTTTCAKCGSLLPSDAPEELCPKCLIVAGLMSQIGVDAPPTADFSPSEVIRGAQAPAAPPVQVIPRLFGGYRIVRPLGKGGMGTVYEAEEEASGRRLALKVLSHSLDSEQARTRFFREGRLAASVNHPNSVYVFGTEEISGLPVITMELAPGGTLHDLVKRDGPLPVAQAVDATLQIIAGLEAAANAGVLHRDVKPSNCFIDGDGAVKVGDFGLSISTLARGEINLTTTASMIGTPAYASPEQLRGEEIDCRSDIYAVGVTLYYLLTAHTPFTADNMVRLVATVLERPAESPRKLRPQIPEELAQVILRCLAKQPSQRFRNYAELRLALLPFNSAAPVPASIGLRFLAGVIDSILALSIPIFSVPFLLPRIVLPVQAGNYSNFSLFFLFLFALFVAPILTFVIPEGLWGATLGKAMLGLRVVGLKRRLPGIPRTLLRAVIVFLTFIIGSRIPQMLGYVGLISKDTHNSVLGTPSANIPLLAALYACVMLLFVTARRRNGLASAQDLLSGTRVVLKPAWQVRSAAVSAPEPAVATDGTPQIGPYHVLAELGRSDLSGLLVGYDARLFRKVWIRRLAEGTVEVPAALRMLTRHGRLRWLGGKRAPGENWDAYEALNGQPLIALLGQPRSWKRVRFWLADLAEELEAGIKDQTVPAALGLDRVWITDDARAKLLDFVAPGVAALVADGRKRDIPRPIAPPLMVPNDRDAQLFLKRVAIAALEGRRPTGVDMADYVPRMPLPLHARSLVTRMGRFPTFDTLMVQLREIRSLPAEISAARRLALLAGCVVPALMVSLCLVFAMVALYRSRGLAGDARQFGELKLCLDQLPALQANHDDNALEQALEVYIAGSFRGLVTNPQSWNTDRYKTILTPDQRRVAEGIVAAHPSESANEFSAASERVKLLGINPQAKGIVGHDPTTGQLTLDVILVATGVWAYLTGLPALLAALLFRGGVLLRGLGLTLVTRDGVPARRWRVLWRGTITWMPVILATTLLPPAPLPVWLLSSALIMIGAVYVGAALWSLRRPQRGVQDWLARTYMVPR